MERTRTPGTLPLAMLAVVLLAGAGRAAAETRTAQGTTTAVSASTLIVKIADADMAFALDAKTVIEAPGAGARTRREGGIKVSDYMKAGGNVVVTYREVNGTKHADSIRPVGSAGGSDPETKLAAGKVKAVSPDSLIVQSGGQDLRFGIARSTRVLFAGAGTATRAAGGRIAITNLVNTGDAVSVSYVDAGGALNAAEVRVTVKAR